MTPYHLAVLIFLLLGALGCSQVAPLGEAHNPALVPPTVISLAAEATPTIPAVPEVATPTPSPRPPLASEVRRGRAESGVIALTFDLGDRVPGSTATVLDILRQKKVRGTFFVAGYWAEANPELLRRIVADGHEVGNHSYDHPNFTQLSAEEMVRQVQRTEEILRAVTGRPSTSYFRPPYGASNETVRRTVSELGFTSVFWSLDSGDWQRETSVQDVIRTVADHAQPGDIVVLHAYFPKTAQALPVILERLRAKGNRLGNLSQVLGQE